MQNLDSANTDSAVQDKKMGEMESEGLNPTVEVLEIQHRYYPLKKKKWKVHH